MKDSRADVLKFWFEHTEPAQWFQVNPAFDDLIRIRFAGDYDLASAGIYDGWMEDGEGSLALILLLDQFSRNMFRGNPRAFATDGKALAVAQNAIENHFDKLLPLEKKRFLYLPFQHAETIVDQDRSVGLFGALKKDDPLSYAHALKHRDIIARFGRFPERNAALGRVSTEAEAAFLKAQSSGF